MDITLTSEDIKRIQGSIKEISDSMTRIDAEKELIKDIIQVTFENHGVDKKKLRKLASIYHKQNLNDVQSETSEVIELYEHLFK